MRKRLGATVASKSTVGQATPEVTVHLGQRASMGEGPCLLNQICVMVGHRSGCSIYRPPYKMKIWVSCSKSREEYTVRGTKIPRFSFHLCIFSSQTHASLLHWTYHIKHKFKDKIVKNFKGVTGSVGLFWIYVLSISQSHQLFLLMTLND